VCDAKRVSEARTRLRKRLSLERLLFFGAAGLGLLFLVWLRLHQPPNIVDDAYITYRYARNIATGVGFVYNAGERVLGTTTPAYALLMALLSRLSGYSDYPRLSLITNTLFDALIFCLALRLTARLSGYRWVGLGAGLLYALEGRALDFSTSGMESSFNTFAVLLTLVLFLEKRDRWAALAAGLAVLVRPDGLTLAAVVFGALGLEALRPNGHQPQALARQFLAHLPWVEAALFVAVVGPWLLFALFYFGNPIPQSILAKSEVYRVPQLMAFRAFLVQLRTVFPFSLPPLQDPEPLFRQILQAVLPVLLCAVGLLAALRRNRRAWVIGAYAALFIVFYSVGNPLWLGWYEIPMMPLYQALVLTAVAWAGGQAARLLPGLSGKNTALTHVAAVQALALAAAGIMTLPHLSRLNVLPWESHQHGLFVLNPAFNKRREADYQLLASMLQPAARNNRLVAIPEIGAFGYDYPGKLFDTSGLVSPQVQKYFPIPADIPVEIYSIPRQMIFDLRPDVFVSFDSFMQVTLPPDDPQFLAQFPPAIGMVSHAAFGIQRLMVYRRADLPIEAALPVDARPAAVTFANGLVGLEGYQLGTWADPQDNYLELTLFWRGSQAPISRELLTRVNLLAATGAQVYQVLDFPGEGLFPTSTWTAGMWLVDRYELKRPKPDAGPYSVSVTLFASDADAPLPAQTLGGRLQDDTFVIPNVGVP
jgi:hypothetical protein